MKTISKEDITKIKEANNIVEVIQAEGIKLIKSGKNFKALCPFHQETDPSFNVSQPKQVFNCFGCGASGDVIHFIEKYRNLNFKGAVKYLDNRTGTKLFKTTPVKRNLLNRVVKYYNQSFLKNQKAQNYLFNKRGIKNKEIVKIYKIGFCDGSLMKALKNQPEHKTNLKELGVITPRGFEAFRNCVIFPIFDENKNCVNIYARRIVKSKIDHIYLPGPNKGVFNWQALKQNDTIILTESIIDSLSFIDAGITNTIPLYGTNGLTDDHLHLLRKHKTKNVYIALDNDAAGKAATEKVIKKISEIPNLNIFKINIPGCKDINEYYLKHSLLTGLLDSPELMTPADQSDQNNTIKIEYINNDITFNIEDRTYKVKKFNLNQTAPNLKINLRAIHEESFYIDYIDLYSARSRENFINGCSDELEIEKEIIKSDLNIIILKLEEYKEQADSKETEESLKYQMTYSEEQEALTLLNDKNLLNKILEDFKTLGYIGEETNKLVGYLAAVSRKLDEPIAVMIMSRSAAGKSSLMDSILKFVPEEDYIKYTAVTGQALFYKGENSLVHKLLAIAEEEGAQRASYSLKTFQSDKELNIAATGKDPKSGKLKTYDYKVKGPIALFITTTAAEIDYETLNRFVILTVDECLKQTQLIHEQQRLDETIEGMINKLKLKNISRKHQNAQRLLKPLIVSIPYAKHLKFVSDRLRARRDHKKYLGLIKTIAFLKQYQRPVKKIQDANITLEYIEATLDDLEEANKLASKILIRTLDELAPPSRTLLKLIQEMVENIIKESAKKKKSNSALKRNKQPVNFTRRNIRDFTKWSDFQIRTHIKQLEHLEYLQVVSGNQGRKYMYELTYEGNYTNEPTIYLTTKKEVMEATKTGKAGKLRGLK